MKSIFVTILLAFLLFSCENQTNTSENTSKKDSATIIKNLLNRYKETNITKDYSLLSEKEKEMIPIFMEITKIIDEMFWYESFGNKDSLCCKIENQELKKLVEINFGPWDRFNNNKVFMKCAEKKPAGANFYPKDITKKEFEQFDAKNKKSKYTFIRRDRNNNLKTIEYNILFKTQINKIVQLLEKAALISEDKKFSNYLKLRAEAFKTDMYAKSDSAWLKTDKNTLDFILGPIEIKDDMLFGYKAAHSSYILIKDKEWTKRLNKYVLMLPFLQKALPVSEELRKENPHIESKLEVCNIIAHGGNSKAGGYYVSISYPEITKSSKINNRSIQFANIVKNKFDNIIVPISNLIMLDNDIKQSDFESYFLFGVLFELGYNLGITKVLNKDINVNEALKETARIMTFLKSNAISLFIAEKLYSVDEIKDLEKIQNIFFVDIIRTMRFGYSNDFSKSSIIIYNYLKNRGAISINRKNKYKLNHKKFKNAITDLITQIIVIQGNGDYNQAKKFIKNNSIVPIEIKNTIQQISDNKTPIDILLNN